MNIVFVTEAFRPLVNGVVNTIDLHRTELRRRGHSVKIIAPHQPSMTLLDPDVVPVPAIPLPGASGYHLTLPALGALDHVIDAADIVHTHHPFTLGHWALKAAARFGKPMLFTQHTEYRQSTHYLPLPDHMTRQPMEQYIRHFANRCTAIISPSAHGAELLTARGISVPIHHVPNGIEVIRFGSGRPGALADELGLAPAVPLLLYVGRLALEKNLDFLLETVLGMEEQPHLAVVGDGPERLRLEQLVHTHAGGHHIHFLGPRQYQQMPNIYAGASVFVTASQTETHPLTLLEASAAGLPIVAIDSPGTRGVIQNRVTGMLTLATKTSFARSVRQLLYRPALRHRLGLASQQHAATQFSVEASVDQLLDTYSLVRRLQRVET